MTLIQLQHQIRDLLAQDEHLATHQLAVFAEDQGDLEQAVDEAVARLGLVAMVATPSLEVTGQDGATIHGPATVLIRVYERSSTARALPGHLTALAAAEHILSLSSTWNNTTPISLAQEPINDDEIIVTVTLRVHIIHTQPKE